MGTHMSKFAEREIEKTVRRSRKAAETLARGEAERKKALAQTPVKE